MLKGNTKGGQFMLQGNTKGGLFILQGNTNVGTYQLIKYTGRIVSPQHRVHFQT